MRKILLLLCFFAIMMPLNVFASINYNGYYCSNKHDLGDGTFYMTCYIVVTSDEDVNQIDGTLILTNVNLESIKTYDDWTSNNGLSTEVNFTADTSHSGTFTVAELVYTGSLSDTECEASFMPNNASYEEPQNFVCMILDGTYYGENGTKVTEEEYYEQCCNYICTVIDNKYYFDSNGNSVTYDEFIEDCSNMSIDTNPEEPIDNPQTGFNYGYIIVLVGIISIITIIKVAKKTTKIYKI